MTDRKIITLSEWAQTNTHANGKPIPQVTAKSWVRKGIISAYLSPPINGVYLLPADTPVPQVERGGRAHKNNRRKKREKAITGES